MCDKSDVMFCVVLGVMILAVIAILKTEPEQFDAVTDKKTGNVTDHTANKYRRVYFADTKFYYLTMNNPVRKKHMLEEFGEFSPIEVNPVAGIPRNMSGSTGFGRMIDIGLRDQDLSKPFQPFVILEDDASKYRKFPQFINIPADADIVYLGLHSWGYGLEDAIDIVYSEPFDKDIIKVKNLLALHGVLVCSPAGASVIQRSMVESFYRDKPWDIPITHAQPFYNVYALSIPLVYQNAKYGGKQHVTKITARKHWFKPMPNKYINKNSTTNIMCWTNKDPITTNEKTDSDKLKTLNVTMYTDVPQTVAPA